MTWLDLFCILLIALYAQWLLYRSWRFEKDLSQATAATEVLENVTEQRHFYWWQGLISLMALTLFLAAKGVLLLFTLPEPTAFTTFALGDFHRQFLLFKLGGLGVGLVVIAIGCFFQWLKSKHYFDVLYALRNPLGLHPESKIHRPPPLPPEIAPRQAI